jgi:hypothetical protein
MRCRVSLQDVLNRGSSSPAEMTIDVFLRYCAVERSCIIGCIGVNEDQASISGVGKDDLNFVTDNFEYVSDVEA